MVAQTQKLFIMITLRLFAYLISPIDEKGVGIKQFRAMDICENTAQLLAKQFKGNIDCSSCGCVQYSDTILLDSLSKEDEEFITNTYPFVKVRRPLLGNQFNN